MASPTVATTTSLSQTGALDMYVNIPTGLVDGDLLIVGVLTNDTGTSSILSTGWTTAWAEVRTDSVVGGGRITVWSNTWRTGDPTGVGNLRIDTPDSQSSVVALRVTGADDTTPVIGSISSSSSSGGAPNPGPVASHASVEMVVVAFGGGDGKGNSFTAPTNYTMEAQNSTSNDGAAANSSIGAISRELTSTSDDPGAFGGSTTSGYWLAATLDIQAPTGPTSVPGSFTANAVIEAPQTGSLTADAVIIDAYDELIIGESGLQAYLPMWETSGTTIEDIVGTYDGTPNGGYTLDEAGIPAGGKSIRLTSASNGYILLDGSPALGDGPFSLEMWIKRASISNSLNEAIWGNDASGPAGFATAATGGGGGGSSVDEIVAWFTGGEFIGHTAGDPVTDTDTFHHVVLTMNADGSEANLYLDSTQYTDSSITQTGIDAGNRIIGNNFADFIRPFDGWVAKAAIYNVELTPTQVSDHYAAGSGVIGVSGSFTADALIITGADLGYDYFGRTSANLEDDTSDSGHTWADTDSQAAKWAVQAANGGEAYASPGASAYTQTNGHLNHTTSVDQRVLSKIRWTGEPVGAETPGFITTARLQDANDHCWMLDIGWRSDGSILAGFRGIDSGGWITTWAIADAAATWTDFATDEFWVEFIVYGTSPTYLEGRIWLDGDARPETPDWSSSATNADVQAAGVGGFWTWGADGGHTIYVSQFEVWSYVPTATGSFTADAVIKASESGSLTANAVSLKPQSGSLTADATLLRTQPGSTTADAVITATVAASLASDAVIQAVSTEGTSVDAVVLATQAGSTSADATVRSTQSGSLTADAWIQPFFTADAYILGGTVSSFIADAVIEAPASSAFAVDAILLDTSSQSFQADALVLASTFGQLDTDAIVLRAQADSLVVAAVLRAVMAGQFDLDAVLRVTNTGAFTDDATILATAAGSMSADAVISLVGRCTWTTPADTVQMSDSPVLAFNMPDTTSGDMHFQIEIDEDSGFGSPIVYQSPGTGWEYWDGGTWQPIPASGVPAVYVGNEARYAVQTPLANGTWYRRVRAGVI